MKTLTEKLAFVSEYYRMPEEVHWHNALPWPRKEAVTWTIGVTQNYFNGRSWTTSTALQRIENGGQEAWNIATIPSIVCIIARRRTKV